jgi:hypothetical protein
VTNPPRILLDEHVWGGLVAIGRRLNADIVLVQTLLPEGTADHDVLALAAAQERLLLTSNAQDFAPLVAQWFVEGREHWGVVVVPGETNRSLLSRALKNILQNHTAESFRNTYRFIQEFV